MQFWCRSETGQRGAIVRSVSFFYFLSPACYLCRLTIGMYAVLIVRYSACSANDGNATRNIYMEYILLGRICLTISLAFSCVFLFTCLVCMHFWRKCMQILSLTNDVSPLNSIVPKNSLLKNSLEVRVQCTMALSSCVCVCVCSVAAHLKYMRSEFMYGACGLHRVYFYENATAIQPKSEHFTTHKIKKFLLISHTYIERDLFFVPCFSFGSL